MREATKKAIYTHMLYIYPYSIHLYIVLFINKEASNESSIHI